MRHVYKEGDEFICLKDMSSYSIQYTLGKKYKCRIEYGTGKSYIPCDNINDCGAYTEALVNNNYFKYLASTMKRSNIQREFRITR